ncbi:MAG TPA: N-acetylmuramoyl-L-alanine amidase [Vicinamibacterales bacterium]|nr:N-acetylmuramoyl-L-alanine amidase [Vicinamibacterales bacterium]
MRMLLTTALVLLTAVPAAAQSAPARYEAALKRETQVRASQPSAGILRSVIAQYEAIVRAYPRSGYSDNALWQAAGLAWLSYERFGQESDRRMAIRLLQQLRRSYPTGTLAKRVPGRIAQMAPAAPVPTRPAAPAPPPSTPSTPAAASISITGVLRSALPAGERLTISMDAEPQYHEERLADPDRLFFDFRNTAAADSAKPSLERIVGGVVRDVRVGSHPGQTTRLVIELEPNTQHSVFALYNPYRLVVDLERTEPGAAPGTRASAPPPITSRVPRAADPIRDAGAPVAPSINSNGSFSLARQLGLGVARIVIDPGHGGHDPGAIANRAREAEVVLDIALRLEKLLLKQKGIDVVLTRRTDVFIPLEERTAIANREGADLFLSIHANVGRNTAANGVETYFLNFATTPEAEAVAARENAGTGMAMHSLPDIVRKIALNNKIDESRDLANVVQASLYRGIRQQNADARNRGVKQAPFVVLIGAQMPSVLTEVSFLTNKKDASLLRTAAYRQRIAQSLFDAILKYRQSLKKVGTIASGAETR